MPHPQEAAAAAAQQASAVEAAKRAAVQDLAQTVLEPRELLQKAVDLIVAHTSAGAAYAAAVADPELEDWPMPEDPGACAARVGVWGARAGAGGGARVGVGGSARVGVSMGTCVRGHGREHGCVRGRWGRMNARVCTHRHGRGSLRKEAHPPLASSAPHTAGPSLSHPPLTHSCITH